MKNCDFFFILFFVFQSIIAGGEPSVGDFASPASGPRLSRGAGAAGLASHATQRASPATTPGCGDPFEVRRYLSLAE